MIFIKDIPNLMVAPYRINLLLTITANLLKVLNLSLVTIIVICVIVMIGFVLLILCSLQSVKQDVQWKCVCFISSVISVENHNTARTKSSFKQTLKRFAAFLYGDARLCVNHDFITTCVLTAKNFLIFASRISSFLSLSVPRISDSPGNI